ncbi:putative conserved hypothetical protein [Colletotrichum tofieldiae]|nr:putative conserved hypothetical protein [Colletotrichum tofieldiae]GKT79971.1 putative conserved hypothetical protein [Colletotrichum tofieldiae]GKT85473.1 putative conserved hypothetical protein [Colletotrichum tofieldiae]
MVWAIQAAALAAASFSVVARAGAIPDINPVDFADNGAPLPSIPAAFAHDLRKRQTSGGYLDTDAGPPITSNCSVASTFIVNSLGQLVVGGSVISMNPGTSFIPLRPISPQGSVTGTFTVSNGELAWVNPAFFDGRAGFCQDTTGQVFATFANPAVAYPPNCSPVQLGSVVAFMWELLAETCRAASTCQSGGIASGSSSTTTRSTSRAPSGPITMTPFTVPTTAAVINSTLTLRPGLYTEAGFVNPAGATCRIVTESWIFGQSTLLPARVPGS